MPCVKTKMLPSPYLAVVGEQGKRHTTRAHLTEAVSDRANRLSLGDHVSFRLH